ncbi:hypothetical protein QN277_000404 [Acacia crassicarpa]|uniref:Uncharacterized protein n=1 Tax=Acacia crassicarpa TaxID=499986 RepID=A0AAE1N7I4_9FABA|nr:hypothetical protein QN277_000404 [Acacia crassicarpa]
MTAPTMAASTTPPAAMLSKKFLRDGVTAASATSGTIMEAVKAAAVRPVMAFSLREALTTSLELGLDDTVTLFEGRRGSGWKNVEVGGAAFFWARAAQAGGMAMETAEVEAISESPLVASCWCGN